MELTLLYHRGEGKYYSHVADSVYAISHFESISLDND